jgi:hypothetical protein
MSWGVCERALQPHRLGKTSRGKAKVKTGIGKSDLPGLQGGPGKRDFVLTDRVRAPRLYPDQDRLSGAGLKTTSRLLRSKAVGSERWGKSARKTCAGAHPRDERK